MDTGSLRFRVTLPPTPRWSLAPPPLIGCPREERLLAPFSVPDIPKFSPGVAVEVRTDKLGIVPRLATIYRNFDALDVVTGPCDPGDFDATVRR